MKAILIVMLVSCAFAVADVPELVLKYKNSYGGYATFAGKLGTKPAEPIGVTVDNAGLKFSTITDKEGNWAITFRQHAVTSDITAWSFSRPDERSAALRVRP